VADVYANAGLIASQIAGDSDELDVVAEELRLRAEGNALANGDVVFAESLEVQNVPAAIRRSVRTRAVVANDPLAAPKEFGHVVRNESGGPVIGYARPLRYMFNAMRSLPEDKGD
jgi:hypothetical protein